MVKAARASALMLLLACSAQAGIMGNESSILPPSQPASVMQEDLMANESPVEEPAANGWVGDKVAVSLTQTAFELLAVLPPLL